MGNFGWIKAQGECRCHRCKADISKGEIAFYLPKSNTYYCKLKYCGQEVEKDLEDVENNPNPSPLKYSNKGMYRAS